MGQMIGEGPYLPRHEEIVRKMEAWQADASHKQPEGIESSRQEANMPSPDTPSHDRRLFIETAIVGAVTVGACVAIALVSGERDDTNSLEQAPKIEFQQKPGQ